MGAAYVLVVTWIVGAGTGAQVIREPDRVMQSAQACEAAADATRRSAGDGTRVLARCLPSQ